MDRKQNLTMQNLDKLMMISKTEKNSLSQGSSQYPVVSPLDLENFLPWASKKLDVGIPVVVKKVIQEEYISASDRKVKKKSLLTSELAGDKDESSNSFEGLDDYTEYVLVILSYDGPNVVRISIDKTKRIPQKLIVLITTIVKFHPYLQVISISCGIDECTIYELSKLLPASNITELFLDDTFVAEANYDILLKEINQLQVLSLARCKIGDKVVKNIAAQLRYPLPASSKLCVLNISTNRLTDLSCKYMAEVLRSNRKLTFLNMAGNTITEKGGKAILDVLLPFPLSTEECLAFNHRYLEFLKKRQDSLVASTSERKLAKKLIIIKKKTLNIQDENKLPKYGDFIDPMTDCTVTNDVKHCNGNNTLTYMNLSYNNIHYPFLKLLLKVLDYQYTKERQMKGLIVVRLEGNPLPINCTEYGLLDQFFEKGISINFAASSITPKRSKSSRTFK